MRIFRYPLEIVDYQQLQPVWPGRILSVAPARVDPLTIGSVHNQGIDLWATAADEHEIRGKVDRYGQPPAPPVLGVWIVGTGHPIPGDIAKHDALFHGTCVMANDLVWHVWTAVVGIAPETPQPLGEVDSIGGLVEKMKTRHADRGAGA